MSSRFTVVAATKYRHSMVCSDAIGHFSPSCGESHEQSSVGAGVGVWDGAGEGGVVGAGVGVCDGVWDGKGVVGAGVGVCDG